LIGFFYVLYFNSAGSQDHSLIFFIDLIPKIKEL